MTVTSDAGRARSWGVRRARVLPLAVLLVLCRGWEAAGQTIAPASGSGMSQTFTLRFEDPAGAAGLQSAWVWFTASFLGSAANSCLVSYDRPTNTLHLVDDAGTGSLSAALGAGGVLQNSSCAIAIEHSAAVLAGTTVTLTLPVRFTAAFTGSKHVFLYSASMSGVATGWHPRGLWTVASMSETVTASAVTPASGTGLQQTFTFAYGEAAGAEHLAKVWAWFTDRWQPTAAGSCLFAYDQPADTLHLLNDAGTAYTSGRPGAAGTLQNSQCAVALAGTTVARSGSSLTLTAPLTFTASFGGYRYVYTEADSAGGSVSGWQPRGTWIVGSGAEPAVVAEAVTPHAGTGMSRTFAVRVRDAAGPADLRRVWVWFSAAFTTTSAGSCLAYYDRPTNLVHLIDDAGTGWRTAALGSEGLLQNSSCAVDVRDAAVVLEGPAMTLHLPVTFTAAFTGSKHVFVDGEDLGGATSGWRVLGTWTVAAMGDTVAASAVTPASGAGARQVFTFDFSDARGAEHLQAGWAWFGEGWAPVVERACFFYYDRPGHQLYLLNDAGTGYSAGTPGTSLTLRNAQCAIALERVSIASTGPSMRLETEVSFAPSFSGAKQVSTVAVATDGTMSGWQTGGTWEVPGAVVTADAVLPASGTGTSGTFALRYSHSGGATLVSRAWVWFSETLAGTAELSCLAYYDRASTSVSLIDDTGTAWQTAALGGSSAPLQNSRCAIDVAHAAATLSDTTLVLSLPVTFDPRASGTRTIFLFADGDGGASGWQARGNWTVPGAADAVTAGLVTVEAGGGAAATFALQFSATAGAASLAQTWVWFSDRFTAVSASSCLVYYEPSSNRVHLRNDGGTAWLSAPAGQRGALQNSQCAIGLPGTGASLAGDTLTLTLPVVFAPNYGGAKHVYLYALGGSALNSGWVRRGTWTAPTVGVSLTPDRSSPQMAGTSMAWTAAADEAASPEYQFWQWDGAVWTVVRDWGGSDMFRWTPPGPGDYRVAVWVRTNGSALDEPQRYTSAAFRIRPRVTDTTLTLSPTASQIVGHAVSLSATASGGLAPYEFKFRVRGEAGDWTVVRDWSAAATATWIPSTIGASTLGVYARSSGASGSAYEAADFRAVTVSPHCTPNTTDGPLYVPESGGNSSIWIDLHPGCQWLAHIETAWLELASAGSGYGPGAVIVRATPNDGETRSGRVSFGGRVVDIVQQGVDSGTCTWSLDDRGKTFDWNDHESSVFVNAPSDCRWTVTAGGDFIDLAGPEERTGPGTVFFSVENNTTPTLRRGVLRLDGRLMMVTQYGVGGGEDPPGCSYSVTPSEPLVGPGNGQYRVWVATGSGCPWTAEGGAWLHPIDGASRSGPGWLDYAVENNTAPEPRVGVMTVAGRTVPVTQPPVDGCDYAVEPATLSVSSGNHAGRIHVAAHPGCSWSAEAVGGFLHMRAAMSGVGAGVVDYAIENNTTMTPRAGTLRIAGITIPVSQLAAGDCTYQVTPLAESLDAGNHTRVVSVSTRADCQWTAASETGFLAVSGAGSTRTGSGEVAYTAENNTSPEGRTGVLQVAGARLTITQLAAGNCTIALDPPSRDVLPGGETFTVTVMTPAGCPWQASTPTPSVIQLWGDLTQTGPGSVEVEVENHTSFTSRTGRVQVGGQTLTVRQAGVCDPTVQPLKRTVNGAAGESVVDVSTGAECVWTAVSEADFLHVRPYSGVGPDSLRFAYDDNLTGAARTGTLTVAGQTVTVTQLAATDPAGAFDPSRDVVRFYHTDAIGSVRMITDATGQVVARYDYLPFGELWSPPAFRDPRLFAGKERDTETGLDYFGARHYSNSTGGFTTIDPVMHIETALTDPQRWNRYAYGLNNPLKFTDPDGRNPALLHWLAQVAQRAASNPAVQRAQQAIANQGSRAWVALTRLFNTPTGQEAIQTVAELTTGAQAPAGLLTALTSTTRAAFLETALAEGRGGVSAAGRALQSHASRAGSWLADLAQGGNAAENNKMAKGVLEMILHRGQPTFGTHPTLGTVIRVRLPDGSGAWWKENGEFIGFLERYTSQQ